MSQAIINFLAGLRNTAKDGLNVTVNGSLTKLTTEPDPVGQEGWTLLIIDKTVTPAKSTVKIYHNGIWEAF